MSSPSDQSSAQQQQPNWIPLYPAVPAGNFSVNGSTNDQVTYQSLPPPQVIVIQQPTTQASEHSHLIKGKSVKPNSKGYIPIADEEGIY